jgi:hypothetical protein
MSAIEHSVSGEPLKLGVDRSEADNVVVGRASSRYSDVHRVWEKMTISLSMRLSPHTAEKPVRNWVVTVTGRMTVWVNEENVDQSFKWHEPSSAQQRTYAAILAGAVEQRLDELCSRGGRQFAKNYGPVIDFTCQ